jgi:ADP-ribose pyrophosphatase YjhB (NUDIX family)
MKTSVFAYIFNENKVLLVKHSNKKNWLPPGGKREKGEDIEQTIIREVKEEVNLKIKVISFTSLSIDKKKHPKNEREIPLPFYITKKKSHHFFFIGYVDNPEKLKVDGFEIIDAKFFSKDDIKKEKNISEFTKEKVYFLFDYIKNKKINL